MIKDYVDSMMVFAQIINPILINLVKANINIPKDKIMDTINKAVTVEKNTATSPTIINHQIVPVVRIKLP